MFWTLNCQILLRREAWWLVFLVFQTLMVWWFFLRTSKGKTLQLQLRIWCCRSNYLQWVGWYGYGLLGPDSSVWTWLLSNSTYTEFNSYEFPSPQVHLIISLIQHPKIDFDLHFIRSLLFTRYFQILQPIRFATPFVSKCEVFIFVLSQTSLIDQVYKIYISI